MNQKIEKIIAQISKLEDELHESLLKNDTVFTLRHGKIVFTQEEIEKQKREAQNLLSYFFSIPFLNIITLPFIYGLIIPALLLDIFTTLYQKICFPVYGIKKVLRKEYIIIDRYRLHHLNLIEKLNCIYCGYFNGLIAYVREVAARTELYWCPIRHTKHPKEPHAYYYRFSEYGKYRELEENLKKQRAWLKEVE